MKKQIVIFAALATAFFSGCNGSERKPGEEFYDPEYQSNRSAVRAGEEDRAGAEVARPNENTDFGAVGSPATAGAGTAAPETTTGTATTGGSTAAPAASAQSPATTQQPAAQRPASQTAQQPAAPAAQQPAAKAAAFSKEEVERGKNLIAKSDCLACHQIDQKVVGPAYTEVADKYPPTEANINALATKIIKGGAGNWGQIPMSPHPGLPEADAQDMVKYILSLKK